MAERLYYHDSYLTEFRAKVVDSSPDGTRVYLDRTAFYPSSGGQPFDQGTLGDRPIVDVIDEGDRVVHVLEHPLGLPTDPAPEVSGAIDWTRRFDHMQQHTGQHLLSAVLLELYNAATVSFHLGADSCTIDVEGPVLDARQLLAAEERANALVFQNRPLTVEYGHSADDLGLRKATAREGSIRIVSIAGVDRTACGGTHVRATGEIGPVLLRKLDKVRGNLRIEFLCGLRAVRQARADYDRLSAIARIFSATIEETPALAETQMQKLQEAEKLTKKLAAELAQVRGRQRYLETIPDSAGMRRVVLRLPSLNEDIRAEAQSFTAGDHATFLAVGENPPSVLLAVSKDAGVMAGDRLKALLSELGGRGGGSAVLAQGSVPSRELLDNILRKLTIE
jgi:alanyl-tRNA synthetase